MNKFYYTYKITLLKGSLAGHYYYGQHRTDNLNDGYAGSGRKIKNYYKKYGKIEHQTYIKEIISFYNNENELNQAEKDLIGDKYKTDELCLNLIPGGTGKGRNKGYKHSIETRQKMSISQKGKHLSKETKEKLSKSRIGKFSGTRSEETRKKMSEAAKNRKPVSEETKKKISEAKKGHIPWNKGLKLNNNNKNDVN